MIEQLKTQQDKLKSQQDKLIIKERHEAWEN
jgi:hypothetical protein